MWPCEMNMGWEIYKNIAIVRAFLNTFIESPVPWLSVESRSGSACEFIFLFAYNEKFKVGPQ